MQLPAPDSAGWLYSRFSSNDLKLRLHFDAAVDTEHGLPMPCLPTMHACARHPLCICFKILERKGRLHSQSKRLHIAHSLSAFTYSSSSCYRRKAGSLYDPFRHND